MECLSGLIGFEYEKVNQLDILVFHYLILRKKLYVLSSIVCRIRWKK
jgi:hypothetical protein